MEFMEFIPTIKNNIGEWRIIDVSLSGETKHNILFITKKIQLYFDDINTEGKIFVCNSKETLTLAHTGDRVPPQRLKKDLVVCLPEFSCDITTAEASANEIKKIQTQMIKDVSNNVGNKEIYDIRKDRKEKIIMIADDDMFMRALAAKSIKKYGKIISVERGNEILDLYLEHLPDLLFLDIHMPGKSGLNVLDEILNIDHKAHIIMLSADSNKSNVLNTSARGAKGFITKPFSNDKLCEFIEKCPTMKIATGI